MIDNKGWDKFRFGYRIYRCKRLTTGNWNVTNDEGTESRTVTHEEFLKHYERLPEEFQDDRQTRSGA